MYIDVYSIVHIDIKSYLLADSHYLFARRRAVGTILEARLTVQG